MSELSSIRSRWTEPHIWSTDELIPQAQKDINFLLNTIELIAELATNLCVNVAKEGR